MPAVAVAAARGSGLAAATAGQTRQRASACSRPPSREALAAGVSRDRPGSGTAGSRRGRFEETRGQIMVKP